jgi:hypothetical protein
MIPPLLLLEPAPSLPGPVVESALASPFTKALLPPQATDTAPAARTVRRAALQSKTNFSARVALIIARALSTRRSVGKMPNVSRFSAQISEAPSRRMASRLAGSRPAAIGSRASGSAA